MLKDKLRQSIFSGAVYSLHQVNILHQKKKKNPMKMKKKGSDRDISKV